MLFKDHENIKKKEKKYWSKWNKNKMRSQNLIIKLTSLFTFSKLDRWYKKKRRK